MQIPKGSFGAASIKTKVREDPLPVALRKTSAAQSHMNLMGQASQYEGGLERIRPSQKKQIAAF